MKNYNKGTRTRLTNREIDVYDIELIKAITEIIGNDNDYELSTKKIGDVYYVEVNSKSLKFNLMGYFKDTDQLLSAIKIHKEVLINKEKEKEDEVNKKFDFIKAMRSYLYDDEDCDDSDDECECNNISKECCDEFDDFDDDYDFDDYDFDDSDDDEDIITEINRYTTFCTEKIINETTNIGNKINDLTNELNNLSDSEKNLIYEVTKHLENKIEEERKYLEYLVTEQFAMLTNALCAKVSKDDKVKSSKNTTKKSNKTEDEFVNKSSKSKKEKSK